MAENEIFQALKKQVTGIKETAKETRSYGENMIKQSLPTETKSMLANFDLKLTRILSYANLMEENHDKLQSFMENYKTSLKEYEKTLKNAIEKLKFQNNDLEAKGNELKDLKCKHQKISSENLIFESEVEALNKKNNELTIEILEIKSNQHLMENNIINLTQTINDMKTEIELLKQPTDPTDKRLKALEEEKQKQDKHNEWQKELYILADFIFELEKKLNRSLKTTKKVNLKMLSFCAEETEERKKFRDLMKSLDMTEYFEKELEIVEVIDEIKHKRLPFAHLETSSFTREDLLKLFMKNFANDEIMMNAFETLLVLEAKIIKEK